MAKITLGFLLSFGSLAVRNKARCNQSFHEIDEWSPTDWACAMAGECGEACNVIKKLKRLETEGNSPANAGLDKDDLYRAAADEIADMVIYADLLMQRMGMSLGDAIRSKFNRTSEQVGSGETL